MHVKREGERGLVLKRLRFSGGALAVAALVAAMVATAAYGITSAVIGGQLGEVSCLNPTGTGTTPSGKPCTAGPSVDDPTGIALMDDGSRIFVTGPSNNAVSIFERDRASGRITVLHDTPCISEGGVQVGGLACGTGRGLNGPVELVSTQNNIYVITDGDDSVVTLTRESPGAKWKQRDPSRNCIWAGASTSNCNQGFGITSPASVVFSGNFVYVGAQNSIAVFKRDSSGALVQLDAPNGCIANDTQGGHCTAVTGLFSGRVVEMDVARGGATLYAVDGTSLLQFTRDTTSGMLSFNKCYNDAGANGCVDVNAMTNPTSLDVNSSGKSVYVAAHGSNAIDVFARNISSGNLAQVALPGGCVSQGGAGGCTSAPHLTGVSKVMVQKTNRFVYAIAGDGTANFKRDAVKFTLTPLAGVGGCTTETGDGGACKLAPGLAGASDWVGTGTNHIYVTGETHNTVAVLKLNAS